MSFAGRIRQRRKELGLSADEVAARLGKNRATLYRYENREIENIPLTLLNPLAEILQTTPAYLMGWTDNSQQELSPAAAEQPLSPVQPVPILGRVSAGMPLYAAEWIEGYTFTDLNHSGEYFALRVKGDSMTAARICDGDLLIVRRQETVDNGEIAVVLVGEDEATVKRFYQDKHVVTLMPQSHNPEYLPQRYDTRKDALQVLGKVMECKISFS